MYLQKTINKMQKSTPTMVIFSNQNQFNYLQKSGALIVLLQLRDSLNLKTLAEIISDLHELPQKNLLLIKEAFVIVKNLINQLLNTILSEKIENRLRQVHTLTYRACLQALEDIKNHESLEKIPSTNELKNLEIKNHALKQKYLEKELEETDICGDSSDYLVFKSYENSYTKQWYGAKIDQAKRFCDVRIEKLSKELSKYQSLIIRERITFESQLEFIDFFNTDIKNKIEWTTKQQEKKYEKFELLITDASKSRNEIYKAYNDAVQTLEDHKQWVINTRRTDAALIIQTQWRKVLKKRAQDEVAELARLAKKQKMLEMLKAKKAGFKR